MNNCFESGCWGFIFFGIVLLLGGPLVLLFVLAVFVIGSLVTRRV